ncbi:MAG: T9SS type A sorting domain-containing protein [Putridiphycobacter sp.]|nr:T9SS type A sorting domain-containing protein [Putridiphycobacter sp.]
MKKILLFAILGSTSVFAQDLYVQTAGASGSGIVSNRYTDAGDTIVASADDFTVNVGDVWHVTDITVSGFRNGTGADMTSMKVEIFADAGGMPSATAIYSADHTIGAIPAPANDTAITITLNSTVDLSAGTYWLSVVGATPGTSRWNWTAVSGAFDAPAMLIDADNYFGLGATSWSTLPSLGLSFTDLSFRIGGNGDFASVEDETLAKISLYPNPVTDIMTIGNVEASEINSISVYSISGQLQSQLPVASQIDLSNLASGTYVIEVSTQAGVIRRKFNKI